MRRVRPATFLKWMQLFWERPETEAAGRGDLYFCYRLFLGRRPDPEGWENWSASIRNGISRRQLVSAFLSSLEFRRRYSFHERERVEIDGVAMFVDKSDHAVSSSILGEHTYEQHVTDALKRELKPDHVFLDIGCSIGWFVLLAAPRLTSGKVIGIEPNHNNLQILYRSIAANRFENVVIHPYAATEKRVLLQLGYDAAYGFVHSPEDVSDDDYVQGVAMDELLQHEPRIDVVKLDIEGHEPVAIRGMQQLIARHRPVLLSEFHPKLMKDHANEDPIAYFNALRNFGYRISVLTFEGKEVPVASADEIMSHWRSVNAAHGSHDTVHLDILARF